MSKVPDVRPFKIHGFELSATGLTVHGRPSFAEYQGVGDFIRRSHQAAGWWLAEWLAYGETRPDWKDKIDDLVDAGLYSEKTLRNVKYVGENVPPSRRRDDVDFSTHAEVASLSPKDQTRFLERAATERLTRQELRNEIRAHKRTKVVDGQAVLEGMFRIILADPPWIYQDSGATEHGEGGKAERHYKGMTIEQLCALPVEAHALPNSILFCWVTTPLLLQNPGPREVIEAWGFKYKTNRTWDKVLGLPGHYGMQVKHEHLIIATRGSCTHDVGAPLDDSVLVERRSDTHSEKPDTMRKFIERHWTRGPYLELFGRQRVPGWSVFGNDARLWAKEARTA